MRPPDRQAPFSALAFKTVAEPSGDQVYVRIYSGEVRSGQMVLNTTTGERERVGRIQRMMGARGQDLESAGAGEIVVLKGLKDTSTGNTLCAERDPLVLEEVRFPEPVVAHALLPEAGTDEARLAGALARLVRDDPTLKFHTDPETRQLILSGMGELHLAISVEKLMRTPDIKVTTGRPTVAYRQTLSQPVTVHTRYIRQSGGRGKYAVITCVFEPLTGDEAEHLAELVQQSGGKPNPSALYFEEKIVGGVVPREFFPGVEQGFREGCLKGARYGFPCVRIRCTLVDGDFHEKDSSKEAFRLAAMECLRDAQAQAGVTLLEPVMKVLATGPATVQGKLPGDLYRRRGEVRSFSVDQGRCQVLATVPLAELFGYAEELRSLSSGTASFTMEPSHYAPVREELARLERTG
jgi:elongation factor G